MIIESYAKYNTVIIPNYLYLICGRGWLNGFVDDDDDRDDQRDIFPYHLLYSPKSVYILQLTKRVDIFYFFFQQTVLTSMTQRRYSRWRLWIIRNKSRINGEKWFRKTLFILSFDTTSMLHNVFEYFYRCWKNNIHKCFTGIQLYH